MRGFSRSRMNQSGLFIERPRFRQLKCQGKDGTGELLCCFEKDCTEAVSMISLLVVNNEAVLSR
jgi:hypothetical protein